MDGSYFLKFACYILSVISTGEAVQFVLKKIIFLYEPHSLIHKSPFQKTDTHTKKSILNGRSWNSEIANLFHIGVKEKMEWSPIIVVPSKASYK